MKVMMRCHLFPQRAADPRAAALLDEFPQFATRGRSIWFDEPAGSKAVQNFILRASEFGLRPWRVKNRPKDRSSEFSCFVYRAYDRDDLKACQLLEMVPDVNEDRAGGWGSWTPDESEFVVSRLRLPSKPLIIPAMLWYRAACPERVKRVLEAADLRNLRFELGARKPFNEDTGLREDPGWKENEERWYAMGSDLVMPPVGPPIVKYNRKFDEVMQREYSEMIHFREPGFDDVELHYAKAEVESVGNFDAALMYEGRPDASLIVSRRFWETCVTNGIECDFKPVRIDAE